MVQLPPPNWRVTSATCFYCKALVTGGQPLRPPPGKTRSSHSFEKECPFQASTKKLSKIDSIFWTICKVSHFQVEIFKTLSLLLVGFQPPRTSGRPSKEAHPAPTCPKTHGFFHLSSRSQSALVGIQKFPVSESLSPWGQRLGDPELSKSANQRFKNFWWFSKPKSKRSSKENIICRWWSWMVFQLAGWVLQLILVKTTYNCTAALLISKKEKSPTKKSGSKVAGSCGFRSQLLEPANKLVVIHSRLVTCQLCSTPIPMFFSVVYEMLMVICWVRDPFAIHVKNKRKD